MDDNYIQYQYLLRGSVDCNVLFCGKRQGSYNHAFMYPVKDLLLCFVKSGSATLRNSHTSDPVALRPGTMYVLYPHDPMQQYVTDAGVQWTIYWIGITGSFVYQFLQHIGVAPECPTLALPHFSIIEDRMEKMVFAMKNLNYNAALQCQEHLYRILALIHEDSCAPEARDYVEQALYIIRHNFGQNLSLESIANSINIDKSYLARLFKEKRNETVMQCLTNCRMAEAERILQSTAYSVREAALFCGFADEFYFSRVFRKHFGVSPSEYRKNLR